MTLEPSHVLGDLLLEARRSGRRIELLSERATIRVETAYEVQEYVTSRLCEEHRERLVAYKVAATSQRSMTAFGAREPASGQLMGSDVRPTGARVALAEMYQPRIEPELVLTLTDELSPDADVHEILKKSRVAAGIEIPDSRYYEWFGRVKLTDLICDNAVAGKAVVDAASVPANEEVPGSVPMRLYHDGELIAEAGSEAVLGSPINSMAWLVRHLRRRHVPISPGVMVFSGSFIPPLPAERGTYSAEFDGVGTVRVIFT